MSVESADDDGYLAEMSDQDIVRFRVRAVECSLHAERSIRDTDREAWLRMAAEWIKLAEDAERRRSNR